MDHWAQKLALGEGQAAFPYLFVKLRRTRCFLSRKSLLWVSQCACVAKLLHVTVSISIKIIRTLLSRAQACELVILGKYVLYLGSSFKMWIFSHFTKIKFLRNKNSCHIFYRHFRKWIFICVINIENTFCCLLARQTPLSSFSDLFAELEKL